MIALLGCLFNFCDFGCQEIESGSESCFEFANEQEQEELFSAMNRVKNLQQDRISSIIAKDMTRNHRRGVSDTVGPVNHCPSAMVISHHT